MQNKRMAERALKSATDTENPAEAPASFELKIFDSLVNGVIIIDQDFKMVYANPAIQQMCGLHSGRIGKKPLSSILTFEPNIFAGIKLIDIGEATPYREVILQPRASSAARIQVTVQPLPGKILEGRLVAAGGEEVEQWLIYIHDVTLEERLQKKYYEQIKEKEEFIKRLDRKLYETSLMFELAQGMNFFKDLVDILNLILSKLEDAFAFSHSITGTVDRDNSVVHTAAIRENSQVLTKTHRTSRNDWIKSFYLRAVSVGEPCFFKKGDNAEIDSYLSQAFTVSYSNYLFVPLVHKDEVGFLFMLDAKQAWRGDDDDLSLLFGIANQLLLAIDNNRLYEESMIDSLTGIYNLRYFQERLSQEFKKAQAIGKPLSVAMIDVDFFKKFNDTHGHAIGDLVLKEVAQSILKTCRDTDTAARYGGEEFVVILPETDAKSAFIACERIRKGIEGLALKAGDVELKVTASLGSSCFPETCGSMSELVTLADAAMYVAKRSGRNNSKAYSADMPKESDKKRN